MRYRVRAVVIASVVCLFTLWSMPAKTQENAAETETSEKVQPATSGNPEFAITTQDPTVPVDQLELLLKPLTLAELENESAAWLILLKTKVQQVSDAEIAIKRQNESINKQQEAADALKNAQESLSKAEEQLKSAAPGSSEYEEATKKFEEAKDNLQKAQDSIQAAQEAKKDIQQDSNLKDAIDKAKETEVLDRGKVDLDKLRSQREQLTAGSLAYDNATQKIDRLEAAIKDFEDAQNKQKETVPDSAEFEAATQQLETAQKNLLTIVDEVEGVKTQDTTEKSSQELNQTEAALNNTQIDGDGSTKVAGSVDSLKDQESIQQQGDKLEQAAENLDKNAQEEAELKNQLVATVTELQSERTALVDRFKVVLDELERKGGTPDSYKKYIEAISIITIDLQDTEGAGVRIMSWLQSEEGGIRWAINIGKFVGIIGVSFFVSQSLGNIVNKSLQQLNGGSELLRQFIVMVVKRGGVVVGVLLALTALEVSLGPILALVGGASFVLAFALQSNLGNFASGLMIMFNKPFDIGDEVKLGGIWGYVDSISLASTKISGFTGQMYVIPNNTVWSGMIENLSHGDIRMVSLLLRVGLEEDLTRVRNLLMEILTSHPKVLENPKPSTFLWNYEGYYMTMYVGAWATHADFWYVYDELIQMIQERFNQENIPVAAHEIQYMVELENHRNGSSRHTTPSFPAPENLTYQSYDG
ncbi:MAG: mechanosensitive ion channel [Sphaerospermopsis sp. SIO1G1]|nr:mechanosensitive ion channel [Sphaerospermopsis sp. SIO1G1]